MIDQELRRRLIQEIKNLVPLFRYLILQTETHAFCLALAGAALLGFFPTRLVVLALFKNILSRQGAHDVLLSTIYAYFPASQEFVRRNLEARMQLMPHGAQLSSL